MDNTPIMKSLARHITKDEMALVTGAATKVIINGPAQEAVGTATEETYRKGSSTPEQLDTIVETP